jgi:hypothetical protein
MVIISEVYNDIDNQHQVHNQVHTTLHRAVNFARISRGTPVKYVLLLELMLIPYNVNTTPAAYDENEGK